MRAQGQAIHYNCDQRLQAHQTVRNIPYMPVEAVIDAIVFCAIKRSHVDAAKLFCRLLLFSPVGIWCFTNRRTSTFPLYAEIQTLFLATMHTAESAS
jgi:hypothetical protein